MVSFTFASLLSCGYLEFPRKKVRPFNLNFFRPQFSFPFIHSFFFLFKSLPLLKVLAPNLVAKSVIRKELCFLAISSEIILVPETYHKIFMGFDPDVVLVCKMSST